MVAALWTLARADGIFAMQLILGISVPLLIVGIFLLRQSEKSRTEVFEQFGNDLSLSFSPKGDDSLLARFGHFQLFSQGDSKKIRNMMHGDANSVELAIMDYIYGWHGRGNPSYLQTVICFHSSALSLPKFELRPEGIVNKIGAASAIRTSTLIRTHSFQISTYFKAKTNR